GQGGQRESSPPRRGSALAPLRSGGVPHAAERCLLEPRRESHLGRKARYHVEHRPGGRELLAACRTPRQVTVEGLLLPWLQLVIHRRGHQPLRLSAPHDRSPHHTKSRRLRLSAWVARKRSAFTAPSLQPIAWPTSR